MISSLHRDGRPLQRDLRWGVYVTFAARTDYAARCFAEYGLPTGPSGRYGALYRPYHLIRLELGISVASAAVRGEATGSARSFQGDAVSVARRDLRAGEVLDGEGGYTVRGVLAPAAGSMARRALPIGLAAGVALLRGVAAETVLTYDDVTVDENAAAVRLRRRLENTARVR